MGKMKLCLCLLILSTIFLTGCQVSYPKVPADRAQNIRPLLPGTPLPSMSLEASGNQKFNLNQFIGGRPAVLMFYRGGWCPSCSDYLVSLQKVMPELEKLGYQLVAITPEKPESLSKYGKIRNLDYKFLSDSTMKATTAMGIAFKASDAQMEKYKKTYQVDLELDSGYKHRLLPVQAVFIVGTDGMVKYTYTDPNYKQWLSPKRILEIAKAEL